MRDLVSSPKLLILNSNQLQQTTDIAVSLVSGSNVSYQAVGVCLQKKLLAVISSEEAAAK